ncbi:DUF4240 domain-containing protein [Nocardia asteroides]|uniref:DUF4240 domain-containing protein n=1 Tax=Nocardia asteroides TaxID=1824 RepID=UPI001E3E6411|nr:DUF4240 domain-containing protein [Nocardia asteroides]UGT53008.1 DUF4240 domain-containing protein [Nocardia asteroides]
MTTLPTETEAARFWDLIETAWERTGSAEARRALLDGEFDHALLGRFIDALRSLSTDLTSAELTALDRVAERALYEIDRADIQAITDGSDDGFLYARGFIVAMGREHYDAVRADPEVAVPDAECEELCYFFAHLHDKLYGGFPETGSGISRETASNPAGWH